MPVNVNRFFRKAGEPVPPPQWEPIQQGVLGGRFSVEVLRAWESAPRWWRIMLAPSALAFDGRETTTANPPKRQSGDALVRVTHGQDGIQPALYATWPAQGASLDVYSSSVQVEALPMSSAMVVGADGPTFAAWADPDAPQPYGSSLRLATGMVTAELGLEQDVYIPPYARRAHVSWGSSSGAFCLFQQLRPTNDSGFAFPLQEIRRAPAGGAFSMEIAPSAAIIRLTNLTTGFLWFDFEVSL